MEEGNAKKEGALPVEGRTAGIVIRHARGGSLSTEVPRIAAFIWGGKVRPQPTLPFGRWKGAA